MSTGNMPLPRPVVHGPNVGNGFTKYTVLELLPNGAVKEQHVIMPSAIKPAQSGKNALADVHAIRAAGEDWWVGNDTFRSSGDLITIPDVSRLHHPAFIPAMVKGALHLLQQKINAEAASSSVQPTTIGSGMCVTGLPAEWQRNDALCGAIGQRMREGSDLFQGKIEVLPESLALIFAVLIDGSGDIVGDPALLNGRIGAGDLGFLTNDFQTVAGRVPLENEQYSDSNLSMRPVLVRIRSILQAASHRSLSLHETDQCIRQGFMMAHGKRIPLPDGWDAPLVSHADALVNYMTEVWSNGSQFDMMVMGGGGAEVAVIQDRIQTKFGQDNVVFIEDGQLAISRGYARFGMYKLKVELKRLQKVAKKKVEHGAT